MTGFPEGESTALLQALVGLSLCKSNSIYSWDLGVKEAGYDCWENSAQPGIDFISLFIKEGDFWEGTLSVNMAGLFMMREREQSSPPLAKKTP